MKCRMCNEDKHVSNFQRYIREDGTKGGYNQNCNSCRDFSLWSKQHFNGMDTYYRHNKEYCDREIKKILDIVGIHNGEELLLKWKKKGSDGV